MKKITSVKNPVIQNLITLHERENRVKSQMFLIEGEHLVTIALLKKRVQTILIDEKYYVKYEYLLKKNSKVNILIVNSIIIKKLSQNVTSQAIIGLCTINKPNIYLQSSNIILIDTIQDPGNLGNILRSMTAFNMSELYLSTKSVDLYNHKVISASQGAIFYINVYYKDFNTFLPQLKKANYNIYGTFLHQNNYQLLNEVNFGTKNAILFGNEGQGINQKYKNDITKNIIIPTLASVESLNLATSVAIVSYCLFTSNILNNILK